MKAQIVSSVLFAASLLAGCSKSDAPSTAAATAAPAPAAGPRTITIQAGDTMKYDVTSIEAKPGEELKVSLTNTGTLPKEAMGHNWILLKAGSDPAAFSLAAQTAKDTNFIPEALKDQIIVHIELLGPKQTGEVSFTAPTAPGEYPFLCSFPAHFALGMKGVLTVK
jgi:azurin